MLGGAVLGGETAKGSVGALQAPREKVSLGAR